MQKKFCDNCGNQISSEAEFCDNCGHSFKQVNNQKNKIRGISFRILSVLVSIVFLIVVFIGIFMLFNGSSAGELSSTMNDNLVTNNQDYYLSHGNFSVYFPGQPTYSISSQEITAGNNVTDDEYYFDINGSSSDAVSATYVSSPFTDSGLTSDENLQDELTYTGNAFGYAVISSNLTTFNGLPAIDYTAFNSSSQQYLAGKDVLNGNDLYMLGYFYPSGQENKQLENTFLNSLVFGQAEGSVVANSSVFYTQVATTNVRNCESTSCDILGTYPINTSISLSYSDSTDLPQWVQINWTDDNGLTHVGYINSSLLGDTPVATSTVEQDSTNTQSESSEGADVSQSQNTSQSLPTVIAQWSPSVALILCNYSDGSADSGSGFLTQYPNGTIVVVTNKHVITNETTGYSATDCQLEIPGDDGNYYTEEGTTFQLSSDGYDWGYIPVPDGDSYFNAIAEENLQICQQQEQTGDNVVVLGYPDYAGQFNDPTATQGIISGYAEPYYTTSAQIESGNSGGVAIDPDKDCYIGIPSAVEVGNYSNLGRILNADVPFQLSY